METITTAFQQENNETFFARLKPVLTPSEEMKVRLAYILAKAGHRNQFRKEVDEKGNKIRYFNHPRNVALILIKELAIFDWQMIATAFLHDGLEDIRGMTPEMIEAYFGTEVCRMVKILTKTKESKKDYWNNLLTNGHWKAIMVKLCDRIDNLRSMEQLTDEFRKKYITETICDVLPLIQKLKDMVVLHQLDGCTYKNVFLLEEKINAETIKYLHLLKT
jgi:GTP pyrophosphokinase